VGQLSCSLGGALADLRFRRGCAELLCGSGWVE